MKILVTGVNGQLGHDVVNELAARGHEVTGSGTSERYRGLQDGTAVTRAPYIKLDITDKAAVRSTVEALHPDAVVNCASWTAVDAAEEPENAEAVRRANAFGPEYIALACKATGSKMIQISTDYVFDGSGTEPRKPDDSDFAPLNYYGRTKLEGEQAVSSILERFFVVRIAWAFGENGSNFVKTMIKVGKTHDVVKVVNDQVGTPTYTADLAVLLADMCESEKYGFYHATNEGGYVSWYEFCKEIYRLCGMNTEVIPVSTEEYGLSRAARPKNSRLDKSKLAENGFKLLPDWREALSRYLSVSGVNGDGPDLQNRHYYIKRKK